MSNSGERETDLFSRPKIFRVNNYPLIQIDFSSLWSVVGVETVMQINVLCTL